MLHSFLSLHPFPQCLHLCLTKFVLLLLLIPLTTDAAASTSSSNNSCCLCSLRRCTLRHCSLLPLQPPPFLFLVSSPWTDKSEYMEIKPFHYEGVLLAITCRIT
ncbi:hypothetical protein V8G54_034422 [Vigna mungo]|uniref:Secreted protein n=1 Tax=Vigna mungo TaxID=3915 RepID=A0AAQ3MPP9_VIGMU